MGRRRRDPVGELRGPQMDLGPCCACGQSGPTVRNIGMLHQRGPIPGRGWGCFVCHLPSDGATVVVCDACFEAKAPYQWACRGYPSTDGRIAIEELSSERFDHDPRYHPELEKN